MRDAIADRQVQDVLRIIEEGTIAEGSYPIEYAESGTRDDMPRDRMLKEHTIIDLCLLYTSPSPRDS